SAPEERGDELDPMARGRLHHRILESFFRQLAAERAFPLRGDERESALLDDVADAVFAEWAEHEQRGHPALFAARARRTRRDVHRLVRAEAGGRLGGGEPRHFEEPFTVAVPPPAGATEPALHVKGVIDRIDVDAGTGDAL